MMPEANAGDVTSPTAPKCVCRGVFTFQGRWQQLSVSYRAAPSYRELKADLVSDYGEVLKRLARYFKAEAGNLLPISRRGLDPAGPCRSLIGKPGAYHCAAEVFGHCRHAGTVRQGRIGPACFGHDIENLQRPRVHDRRVI